MTARDGVGRANGRTVTAMNEFLAEHWVMIYGMFMWGMGYIAGYLNRKRR